MVQVSSLQLERPAVFGALVFTDFERKSATDMSARAGCVICCVNGKRFPECVSVRKLPARA